MFNLRKDPVLKIWSLVQNIGESIPNLPPVEDHPEDRCIFCPGNESKMPNEILSFKKDGTNEWQLRVIPHKNPKLKVEVELSREGVGMYDTISNTGAHEIIIEYPKHGVHFVDMPLDNIRKIFYGYRARISDLFNDKRMKYVLIYRNYGLNNSMPHGISGHPHSRLIALPLTPRVLKEELYSARNYYQRKERCLFCDIISDTIRTEDRVIYEDEIFLAFAPFAARFPFEIWIAPKKHNSDYTRINDNEINQLAIAMTTILAKIRKSLNNPPFKYVLHTAPNKVYHPGYWTSLDEDYHWHIELNPILFEEQGFELYTDFYINTVMPETYAKYLRELTE